MSVVAETLGVARSNLAARKTGKSKPRGRYRKAEDVDLAPLIRAIVDERPDLWLSPRLRAGEPKAAGRGQAARERQARAADHAEQRPDVGATYRAPAGPHP